MDLNVRAFRTVQSALAGLPQPTKRQEAAKKGGLAGGPSRAKSMTAERHAEIARCASSARWHAKRTKTSA